MCIGVQKGGTSTLAAHVTQHPLVQPAGRKEPLFFNGNDHQQDRDWCHPNKVCVSVCVCVVRGGKLCV